MTLDERIWSKSQMGLLRECKRKWRFHTQSDADEIKPFKNLKNRYLWVGNTIHTAVGDTIKLIRQGSGIPDIETLLSKVKEKMRAEFTASKENKEKTGERFFEHEYNVSLSPTIWKQQWEKVEASLRWFYQSSWFKRLSQLPPESWKTVDEVLSCQIDEVKAYVKIDCAVEVDGRFILIDWKTSAIKETDRKDALMMALYAHEVWGAEPEQISLNLVSLSEGKHQTFPVSEEEMMDAFLRIQDEGNLLSEENQSLPLSPMEVPMTTNRGLCQYCNYKKFCFAKES